jgi:hypothetical protein
MERTDDTRIAAAVEHADFPYPPSWVDRLMAWVALRPGPAWLYYFGVAALFHAVYLLVKWQEGELGDALSPWGALVASTGFYYLASVHYLDNVARDAMERFRPAIEAPPRRVAELEYRLTTMPPHMVWLMTLLGLLEGGLTIAGMLSGTLAYPGPLAFATLPAAVLEATIILLIGVFFVIAVYHTVHQLRVVSIIYTELTKVDLFKQGPLHAFARLAAYTAAVWLIPQYFWQTIGLEAAASRVSLGFLCMAVVLGWITFTWPLLGIHRLLVGEKDRLQDTVTKRLQECLQAFDQALERGDLAQMDGIHKAIESAVRERQIVDALPTWPWPPGTLRGALTAFLLPLFLWLATRLLERFVGP